MSVRILNINFNVTWFDFNDVANYQHCNLFNILNHVSELRLVNILTLST